MAGLVSLAKSREQALAYFEMARPVVRTDRMAERGVALQQAPT